MADRQWTNALDVEVDASIPNSRTTRETDCPVVNAMELETYQPASEPVAESCVVCRGTGFIRWDQPVPQPDGSWLIVKAEHPCTNGCSGWTPPIDPETVVEVLDMTPIEPA